MTPQQSNRFDCITFTSLAMVVALIVVTRPWQMSASVGLAIGMVAVLWLVVAMFKRGDVR